jgi:Holliday junction resolvasome RuvABC endonuclease subunit
MKILALDLSTKSTGWAVFDNSKLLDYGCVTATSTNVLNRIEKITDELKIIYDRYTPDNIIVEEVLPEDVEHNQQVFKALMYMQASVALAFNKRGKKLEFYTVNEWRKQCGIRTGRGIKRNVVKAADMKFVEDNYNIKANDDVCDAICIGHVYTHQSKVTDDGFEFK